MATEDVQSSAAAPEDRTYRRQDELPLFAPPAADDELLVPARMVNEWVYCPRLAVLE